jgi:hypothetical protein
MFDSILGAMDKYFTSEFVYVIPYCVRILVAKMLFMATKIPSNVTVYSYGWNMPYFMHILV